MASQITYDDKVSIRTSELPNANKCRAEDLNEIKTVVNANANELNETVQSLNGTIQYPTYTNGQDISSTRRTYFQKIGNRVFINLNVNVTISANQYLAIFNLPEGYKPKYEVYAVAVRSGHDNYLQIYANPSGTLGLFSSGALTNSNIAGEISFIVEEG